MSHTTVEDLCKGLRRITYKAKLQKEWVDDFGSSKRKNRAFACNSNPKTALMYFDYYFNLDITLERISEMNDEQASNMLFDLSHFPWEMVKQRLVA
jgi:hypothetical protein